MNQKIDRVELARSMSAELWEKWRDLTESGFTESAHFAACAAMALDDLLARQPILVQAAE